MIAKLVPWLGGLLMAVSTADLAQQSTGQKPGTLEEFLSSIGVLIIGAISIVLAYLWRRKTDRDSQEHFRADLASAKKTISELRAKLDRELEEEKRKVSTLEEKIEFQELKITAFQIAYSRICGHFNALDLLPNWAKMPDDKKPEDSEIVLYDSSEIVALTALAKERQAHSRARKA